MSELKTAETRARRGNTALFLLPLSICIAGIVLLAKGLYPVNLPPMKDPDFIDTVFDNRAVLWAARLLLVSVLAFGGSFIVVSIVIRMKNGEWLRRAGPFEVSETVNEIEGRIDFWRATARVRQEEVVELTERLEESDELIQQLRTAFASGSIVEGRRGHP
ncbi:MAG: hypothetical protein ACTHLH_04010 [Solirubrobacterales bacterium]